MNNQDFDFSNLSAYREGNQLEAKKATKGVPNSIWETYSSFANTDGGLILLGVEEAKDHALHAVHLDDPEALIRDFWNTINNPQKVSLNILTDSMVRTQEVDGETIVVIEVPRAERELRPIYVGLDPVKGTFRRNHEGDYHCTREQVSAMFRDAAQVSIDKKVLTYMDKSVFCQDSINDYRILFNAKHPNHAWTKLDDELFLRRIGAMGVDTETKTVHPTIAGLLMFGYEYEIVREFSQYFLDYQERMDPSIRWTHRVISSSGDWSGNLFDFYFRIINRLTSDLPVPFKLVNNERDDDTPLHETVREALLNALVHADYYGRMGTVIIKSPETLSFANPGDMRISLAMAMEGGFSDPRNATLMKMFGMIGVGERAGSGVPNIIATWENETQHRPSYKIMYSPERVMCTIFVAGSGSETSDKLPINDGISDKISESGLKSGSKSGLKSGLETRKWTGKKLNARQEAIVEWISNNPNTTYDEMSERFGVSRQTIYKDVKKLQALGIIAREGEDFGGVWKKVSQ